MPRNTVSDTEKLRRVNEARAVVQSADVALLRHAIETSGLSARRFATERLIRDERTVRRWLSGKTPIPMTVVVWLYAHFGSPPR